ncbi:MAG: VWA domain-containing protein [Firmicutes bacterium]|nr:VWA domain-containing protein [Bacillota bacterium]
MKKNLLLTMMLSIILIVFVALGLAACACEIGRKLQPAEPNWGQWVVNTNATCLEYGEETRICQNDSSRIETRPINPLGHNFINQEPNNILIIQNNNEAQELYNAIKDEFAVIVKNIEDVPTTTIALKAWDKIILMDISYQGMPDGFAKALYSFVYDYGGGVLTVGGGEYGADNPFSQMKPFSPKALFEPIALMIVLDTSGSMNMIDAGANQSRIALARQAIIQLISELNSWDYVGIITFSHSPILLEPLSILESARQTDRDRLIRRVGVITAAGSTNYAPALRMANQHVMAPTNSQIVYNRHILFITDGEPTDDGGLAASYPYLDGIKENGVMFSVIVINCSSDVVAIDTVDGMMNRTGGHGIALRLNSIDITRGAIEALNHIRGEASASLEIQFNLFSRYDSFGYIFWLYGGVSKAGIGFLTSETIMYPYMISFYIRWHFGQGQVGSLLTRLHDEWGYGFFSYVASINLITNIIRGLMPEYSFRQACARCNLIK